MLINGEFDPLLRKVGLSGGVAALALVDRGEREGCLLGALRNKRGSLGMRHDAKT